MYINVQMVLLTFEAFACMKTEALQQLYPLYIM